ncbi:MAG: YggS family pyridoxal phosphate-dependent enzyme [candidate division Zixibacteria bacterium]|nr:YggS family pyridoxal phosphate-dependent enzyme [candidate division Zixibacteria bacterium]
MKEELSDNLRELHGRIVEACDEYDRDADDIIIVAITKTHPAVAIKRVVAAGIHNIGESRIQEAEPKIIEVGQIARFHMVGHLQSNKVKKAVELFDVIQSVDSYKLAEEIDRRAAEIDRIIECYVEVNCSGEDQKYGAAPGKVVELIQRVNYLDNINLTGLMTVGPLTDDREHIRRTFRMCQEIFKEGRDIVGDDFDTLSMGMTDDFELAIAEGSTMIRIGTGIFGPRED